MLKLLKKILIFTLIFLSSFFVIKDVAFADESETTEYNYSIYFKDNPTDSAKQSGSYVENTFQLTFSTDYEICAYWEKVATSGYRIFFIKKDNSGTITSNLIFCAAVFVQISNSYDFSNHYIKYYNNAISEEVINGNDGVNGLYIDDYSEPGNLREDVLSTTFPIFTNEEMALGYMNGDNSLSDALNYVDLVNSNTEYDCVDIPVPRNLKVIEESGKYYLTWEQNDEDLDKMSGTLISLDNSDIYYRYEPLKNFIYTNTWIDDVDTLLYGSKDLDFEYEFSLVPEALSQKVNITASMLEFKKACINRGWVAFKTDLIYNVYNILGISDSSGTLTGVRYSPIVKAIVHVEWTEDAGMTVEVDYQEVTTDGSYVEDSEYNDVNYGSELLGGSSGTSFISNIASGFNLLGDNGLISLLTSSFSYIPKEIWTLLGAALSIFVIVALFKLIL